MRNDPEKHMNKLLAPTQSLDNPADLFMFVCFIFPWFPEDGKLGVKSLCLNSEVNKNLSS